MGAYRPKIRSVQLFVQELPDELLVYDVERNQVHCLNGSAARVWALCDGGRSVAEITQLLGSDLDPEAAEAVVWGALDQFAERELLEEGEGSLAAFRPADMTRRQMMLRLGIAVGLLAVVDSIISPPQTALASPAGVTGGSTGSTPP